MKGHGEPDPMYVAARAALLDTLDALREHRNALILVGAQAVYIHTGATTLPIAEYTTDADFCIAPDLLADSPLLADRLFASGYEIGVNPGSWISPRGITVDLMVPEALAGAGSRGARLGPPWEPRRTSCQGAGSLASRSPANSHRRARTI